MWNSPVGYYQIGILRNYDIEVRRVERVLIAYVYTDWVFVANLSQPRPRGYKTFFVLNSA